MGQDPAQPDRFVWPPQNGQHRDEQREAHTPPAGGAAAPESPTTPTISATPDAPTLRAAPTAPGVGSSGGVWSAVERVFLGPVSVGFSAAAAQEGWRADAAWAYCGRCGTSVGMFEADGDGCPACRDRRLAWSRFVRVGAYDGLLREAIGELKFGRWKRIADELGGQLGEALGRELRASGIDPTSAVLVPVPTTFRRRVGRGVDHAGLLARAAAGACGAGWARVLCRRHGPHQTGLAAAERRKNVRGVFARRGGLAGGWSARRLAEEGVVWVMVDDIRTTGATMTEACRALRGTDASGRGGDVGPDRVWAAVVAVTPERGRRGPGEKGGGEDLEET